MLSRVLHSATTVQVPERCHITPLTLTDILDLELKYVAIVFICTGVVDTVSSPSDFSRVELLPLRGLCLLCSSIRSGFSGHPSLTVTICPFHSETALVKGHSSAKAVCLPPGLSRSGRVERQRPAEFSGWGGGTGQIQGWKEKHFGDPYAENIRSLSIAIYSNYILP